MSELVEYNNSLKEGEKKLESNEFFQDLCRLMENEHFKRFLDKHTASVTIHDCNYSIFDIAEVLYAIPGYGSNADMVNEIHNKRKIMLILRFS